MDIPKSHLNNTAGFSFSFAKFYYDYQVKFSDNSYYDGGIKNSKNLLGPQDTLKPRD